MNETMITIFGLAGGLALFLFGMHSMSDALQKAAGDKMKKILGFLTKNPLMGALAGAIVTAVLQSSSATTVMAIGFVSAGLINLPQAISIIFGANIGTTMTAQLLAFKISDYIYPIIFAGFIIWFICKSEKVKSIGMVIFSFGVLFEGIEIMGSVMKPLAESEFFIDLMGKVADIPILGVGLGTMMTLVVQSSSATIAVLQNFAQQAGPDGVSSVIGLAGAIPILLGDNIGTTITALLASIGRNKNARRAAIAHSIFNISGTCLFLPILPLFIRFVEWISPKGAELDIISRQIANAHTSFNVAMVIIWVPLLPVMVKIVKFIIRGDDELEGRAHSKFLDPKVIGQPIPALYLVSKELNNTAGRSGDMIDELGKSAYGKNPDEALVRFKALYDEVTGVRDETQDYISRILATGIVDEEQSDQASGLLFINNCVGRMADRCGDIEKIMSGWRETGKSMSDAAKADLKVCFEGIIDELHAAMEAARTSDTSLARRVIEEKQKLIKKQRKFNKNHVTRVKNKQCDKAMTAGYADIIYNLGRMADCCAAVAEEVLDGLSYVHLKPVVPEQPVLQYNNAV